MVCFCVGCQTKKGNKKYLAVSLKIPINYLIILRSHLASFVQCPLKRKSSSCLPCVSLLELFHEPVLKRLLLWFSDSCAIKPKNSRWENQAKRVNPSTKPKHHFSLSQYTLCKMVHHSCKMFMNEAHHWTQSRSGITHLHHSCFLYWKKKPYKNGE